MNECHSKRKIKCCGFLIIRIQRKSTCSIYNRKISSKIASELFLVGRESKPKEHRASKRKNSKRAMPSAK